MSKKRYISKGVENVKKNDVQHVLQRTLFYMEKLTITSNVFSAVFAINRLFGKVN